jgi:DNA polymerase II large subunit
MSWKEIDSELTDVVEDLYYTATLLDKKKKYKDSAKLADIADMVYKFRARLKGR